MYELKLLMDLDLPQTGLALQEGVEYPMYYHLIGLQEKINLCIM